MPNRIPIRGTFRNKSAQMKYKVDFIDAVFAPGFLTQFLQGSAYPNLILLPIGRRVARYNRQACIIVLPKAKKQVASYKAGCPGQQDSSPTPCTHS
jgi:hypothetical protein